MSSKPSKKPSADATDKDFVWVCGTSDDGAGYEVLRQRGSAVEAGVVRPLVEGKPIHGEVVRLTPRPESPALFDVEVQHRAPRLVGRPAQVATDEYRRGWASIWASKPEVHALN